MWKFYHIDQMGPNFNSKKLQHPLGKAIIYYHATKDFSSPSSTTTPPPPTKHKQLTYWGVLFVWLGSASIIMEQAKKGLLTLSLTTRS